MSMDMLSRVFDILQRVGGMEQINRFMMAIYGVICVFGLLNCILGYRILRFWMMLFGFLIGACTGFGVTYLSGVNDWKMIIGAMAGLGVVLAIVSFLIYRAGIFVLGFGIGVSLSIYLVHPTSSFTFFLCLLIGVGLGILAMRYAKGVIIIGTSVLGGILAGVSLAQLGGLAQFPYGVGIAAGIAILGIAIQFAINRERDDDDEDEEKPEEKSDNCTKKRNTVSDNTSYDNRDRQNVSSEKRSGRDDEKRRNDNRSYRRNDESDRKNSRLREESERERRYTERRNSSENRHKGSDRKSNTGINVRNSFSESRKKTRGSSDRSRTGGRDLKSSDNRDRSRSRYSDKGYSERKNISTGSFRRSRYEDPDDYDIRDSRDVSKDVEYDSEYISDMDTYENFEEDQQRERRLDIENMADFELDDYDEWEDD